MEHQWLLVVFFSLVGQARANPWHFGEDHPSYRVIYQISGQIWPFSYSTRQIITIPPCMTLKYVQVTVYNPWSIPTVKYHPSIKTVSIVYGLLQHTKSGYDIVAKGYRTPHCTPGVIDDGNSYMPFRLKGSNTPKDMRTAVDGFYDRMEQNVNVARVENNNRNWEGIFYTKTFDAIGRVDNKDSAHLMATGDETI